MVPPSPISRATIVIAVLLMSACSGTERISGQLPSPQKLEQVEIGISTKQDVRRLFGTPSITPLFDDSHWYYSRKVTDTLAFRTRRVQQKALSVHFNGEGIVENLVLLDEEDMYGIEHAQRVTPSEGIRTTIWHQIFKNYGRMPTVAPAGRP